MVNGYDKNQARPINYICTELEKFIRLMFLDSSRWRIELRQKEEKKRRKNRERDKTVFFLKIIVPNYVFNRCFIRMKVKSKGIKEANKCIINKTQT